MNYTDLRQRSLEDLVNEVQALAAVASDEQVRSVAAVAARCTIELADGMQSLRDITFTAKRQLVERLDALGGILTSLEHAMSSASEESSTQIRALHEAIRAAATQSSAQTDVLLKWNKALVVATGLYTIIAFGLLLVTLWK